VFALWNPEQAPRPTALDIVADGLWREVEANWDEATRHEAFVRYCLQHDLLAAAGRCYRERLDRDPGDTMAASMQAEILKRATLTISTGQPRPLSEPVTRSKWFWTVVLAAMALAIAASFIWRPRPVGPRKHKSPATQYQGPSPRHPVR
jgi:hypothetical protein